MKRVLLAISLLCVTPSILAVNVQTFRPNIGATGAFSLLGSQPAKPRTFRLGLSTGFAGDPLKLRDAAGVAVQSVVKSMGTADVGLEYGLLDRWSLGLSAPFSSTRHIPVGGGLTLGNSVGAGDLLVYGKVLLTEPDSTGIGVGLVPFVEAPLGNVNTFTGNQQANYGAQLVLDKQWARFALTLNAGYRGWATNDETIAVIGSTGAIPLDDELTFGVGGSFAAIPEKLDLVAEVRGSSVLQNFAGSNTSSPVEIDAGIKAHFLDNRLTLNAGGGAGLVRGYSAPLYRVFTGLTYEIPLRSPEKKAAVRQTIVLRDVNFETASHALTAFARDLLGQHVTALRREPGLRLRVEGHTDNRAGDAYNLSLSQRRADTVKAYFVANGIDGARIDATGFGESRPLVSNSTPDNLAQNRRVVVQTLEYR